MFCMRTKLWVNYDVSLNNVSIINFILNRSSDQYEFSIIVKAILYNKTWWD